MHAAEYLRARWGIPCSEKTLAKLACIGGDRFSMTICVAFLSLPRAHRMVTVSQSYLIVDEYFASFAAFSSPWS